MFLVITVYPFGHRAVWGSSMGFTTQAISTQPPQGHHRPPCCPADLEASSSVNLGNNVSLKIAMKDRRMK